MTSWKQKLSAIRAEAGRKGGRAIKTSPSGFSALSKESRQAISRMGVEARLKLPPTLRIDKRICYLDDCRSKPCPIRVKAWGKMYDFCCWSHALIGVGRKTQEVEESLNA